MGKGTDINYPKQPSYGESMRDAMQAQIDLGEDLYSAEAKYRPKYAQMETGILGQTLLGPEGGREFQQRGLLDLMGAPAQQYATGGVVQDPWDDPAAAQFEQGYGGGQQAPLGRGPFAGEPQRGGMGQRGMNGMSGKFGQQGAKPRYFEQAPGRAGGGGRASESFIQQERRLGQPVGGQQRSGIMEPTPAPREGGRGGFRGAYSTDDSGQRWYQPPMPDSGGQMQAMVMPDRIRVDAGGGRAMQGTGRALGAGQDQRIRRPAQRAAQQDFQGDPWLNPADPMSGYSRMIRQMTMEPQAAREAEARFNAPREPVAEIGDTGMMGQSRAPGMTSELDPYTGRPKFGGMAQYGADIAEYGAGRQRAADIRDVGLYGQQATRALREADPLSGMMLGKMAGIAGQEMGGAAQGRFDDPLLGAMRGQAGMELARGDLGYGGLLGMMGGQAREGMAAGDDLTARERSRAIQESRQASEARGRQFDPLAAVNELEALERARSARRQERRGFAGQVMQAEEARKGTGRQYASNLLAMEGARRGEARGYGQQVLGASRAMSADPFMAILGRPSGAGQQIAQQGMGQAQYGLSAGPGVVFNPEGGLNYMLGQQANEMSLAGAQAGAKAQKQAGMMSMLGSFAMACWVAREVYGESNPKWKQFRSWMLNKAPDWFREWYLANGESVAEHIKDKPELKARIKIFMDSKLEA